MNRRQRKIEKKRKKRDLFKKRAQAAAAARPSWVERVQRAAERAPFGPCAISNGWDAAESESESEPELVSVIVTRRLPDGDLLPAMALVDRTCLGVKDAFVAIPIHPTEFDEFIAEIGRAHGGMQACDPLLAQSIVFHGLDYARKLGFEPHADFREALFGPRPDELLETPWHAPERPFYVSGPNDDLRRILRRLSAAVGEDGFDFVDASGVALDFDDLEDWDDGFEGDELGGDEEDEALFVDEEHEFGDDGFASENAEAPALEPESSGADGENAKIEVA